MDKKKDVLSTEETEQNINKADSSDAADKLDSLAIDSEDNSSVIESPEDTEKFEAFMSEYRKLMGRNLTAREPIVEDDQEEYLIPRPQRSAQRKKGKKAVNPSDDAKSTSEVLDERITLEPEEYDDGSENPMQEIQEDDEIVPDFDLGEPKEDSGDKFQISINFEGEKQEENPPVEIETKEDKYDPEKPRLVDWVFDLCEMFVFVLLAVVLLTSFLFKHSIVDGNSMLNTLENGDHLIISDVFYVPERGDIIVFEDYSTPLKKAVVKRVIGLPGETVEVKKNLSGDFIVYINGVLLEEEYAYNNIDFSSPNTGTWVVPEGEIFVMGDNRYNSTDSRDIGTIKIDSILGKVLIRFYPVEKFGTVK